MMGDNRDNSTDSRFPPPSGVGFVPAENLVGRANIIFFSIADRASPLEIWRWPSVAAPEPLLQPGALIAAGHGDAQTDRRGAGRGARGADRPSLSRRRAAAPRAHPCQRARLDRRRLRAARVPRRPRARPGHRRSGLPGVPAGARRRALGPPQRAGQRRDAGRDRRGDRPAAAHPHRQRAAHARGAQARQPARRRAGGADRRALSGRRHRSRQRPSSPATGSRARGRSARPAATPRPSCRNGPTSTPRRCPPMRWRAARGPTTTRSSPSASQVGELPPATGIGRSKREAEQAAAMAVLLREGVWAQAEDACP